jgi:hypothetical protein
VTTGCGIVTACGDDDGGNFTPDGYTKRDNNPVIDDEIPIELLGSWNCDDGKRFLSFTFNADGTGTGSVDFEGTTRESHRDYTFTYTYRNGTVTCTGSEVYYDTDGKLITNKNWTTTFTFNGKVLRGGPYSGDASSSIYTFGGGEAVEQVELLPRQLVGRWVYEGPDLTSGGSSNTRYKEWSFNFDGTGTGYDQLAGNSRLYYSFTYVYKGGKLLLDVDSWYSSGTHQHLRIDDLVWEDGQLKQTTYGYVFTRDGENPGDYPADAYQQKSGIEDVWMDDFSVKTLDEKTGKEQVKFILWTFEGKSMNLETFTCEGTNLRQETNRHIEWFSYQGPIAAITFSYDGSTITMTGQGESLTCPYTLNGNKLTITQTVDGKTTTTELRRATWFERQLAQLIRDKNNPS